MKWLDKAKQARKEIFGDEVFYKPEDPKDQGGYYDDVIIIDDGPDVIIVDDGPDVVVVEEEVVVVDDAYEGGDEDSKKVDPERHYYLKLEVKTDPAAYQEAAPLLD